jgi:hypothetical protein
MRRRDGAACPSQAAAYHLFAPGGRRSDAADRPVVGLSADHLHRAAGFVACAAYAAIANRDYYAALYLSLF